MKHDIVLRVIAKIITPFIIIYAFYIQVHGELSPGGGFQAGAILASAFILYSIVCNVNYTSQILSMKMLKIFAASGVLIYCFTGIFSILAGLNYLDYSYLSINNSAAQRLGIMIVEFGVGITVFSVILIIFLSIIKYKS